MSQYVGRLRVLLTQNERLDVSSATTSSEWLSRSTQCPVVSTHQSSCHTGCNLQKIGLSPKPSLETLSLSLALVLGQAVRPKDPEMYYQTKG